MGRNILSGLLLVGSCLMTLNALASEELDHDKKMTNVQERVKSLPGTVVVRVQDGTGVIEIAQAKETLKPKALTNDLSFRAVKMDTAYAYSKDGGSSPLAELDQDRGQETWYFYVGYRGGFYYPSYWYAGYSYAYRPYYSYWYGGYAYSYYNYYNYYPPYYARPCCWY